LMFPSVKRKLPTPKEKPRDAQERGAFDVEERVEDLLLREEDNLESWWAGQLERRSRVAEVCAREGLTDQPLRIHFLFDSKHRLLFCRNAKVGTTTWLQHFLALSDLPQMQKKEIGQHLHMKVPQLFTFHPEDLPISSLAKTTISFSMVRHPFVRLVSAYENKVVRAPGIYAALRSKLKKHFGDFSFSSFVKMITLEGKRVCNAPGKSDCGFNGHWRPFVSRCAYCTTPYTIIAKFETFKEDLRYIGMIANITFVDKVQNNPSGMNTEQLTKIYFTQLDRSLVEALVQQYRLDFEMFDYDPKIFLNLDKN